MLQESHNKIWGTIIVFVWRDWGEPWTMSVRLGGLYCEIELWTLEIQMLTVWPHNLFYILYQNAALFSLSYKCRQLDHIIYSSCIIQYQYASLFSCKYKCWQFWTTSFIVYILYNGSMLLYFLASTKADSLNT